MTVHDKPGTDAGPPGLRGVLRVRDMRLLLAGFVASRTGDFLYTVALVVYVAETTNSAAWVAASSLARLVPVIILKPVAGVFGDRLPVRGLLVGCDLAQAGCMLAMAGLVAAGAPPLPVLALAAVSSAFSTPYFPVLTAITPRLVAENQLAASNTVVGTVENLALVVGPAAGGLLLLLGPASIPIALNAFSFLASAFFVASIRYRGNPARADGVEGLPGDDVDGSGETTGSFARQLAEGFRATVADPGVVVLASFTSAVTFVYGFELVYLVFVARDRLGIGPEGVGYLNAAVGIGGVLGALLTNRLADSSRVRAVFLLTLLGCGLPLLLLGVIRTPWLALVVLGIEGAASIALDVLVVTGLQRIVRQRLLGRVSSIVDSFAVLAILLGNVAAVALLAVLGLRSSLLVSGALLPVLGLCLLPMLGDLQVRINASRDVLGPTVEQLAASRLLDGAGRPVLERLATGAVREKVPAGTVLLREGDEADDVLVLVAGRCTVTSQGRQINVVSSPAYVGEIGLVGRIPRTATVTAEVDCELLRIAGADFLDAVAGTPPVSLLSEMSVRLERSGSGSGRRRS